MDSIGRKRACLGGRRCPLKAIDTSPRGSQCWHDELSFWRKVNISVRFHGTNSSYPFLFGTQYAVVCIALVYDLGTYIFEHIHHEDAGMLAGVRPILSSWIYNTRQANPWFLVFLRFSMVGATRRVQCQLHMGIVLPPHDLECFLPLAIC